MTVKVISDLSSRVTPQATDAIPVMQNGVLYRMTRKQWQTLDVYTTSSLPTPGTPGRMVFNRDYGLLMVDNGVQWTLWTGSPFFFHADYTTAATAGGTFSRSGDGLALNASGVYASYSTDTPRFEYVDGVAGLLLEASQENLLLQSANLDDTSSPWMGNGDFTIEALASVLPGQTAYRHTNDGGGARLRRQDGVGTFTGSPETAVLLIENVDAGETRLGVFNQTEAGTTVARADFDWSTLTWGSVVGDATATSTAVVAITPSLVLCAITYTSVDTGDTRDIFVYPTGASTNTNTAIIHYAGLVEAAYFTSPIVTAGSSVTRAAEELYYDFGVPAAKPWSAYVRFVAPSQGAPALLRISNTAPDLVLQVTSGGEIQVTHDNNTSTVSSVTSGLSMSQGDIVEARVRFGADGKVTVGASVNEGTEVVGSQSAALTPAAWGSAELYPGGLSSEMARVILREIKVHPDPDLTMSQLRAA